MRPLAGRPEDVARVAVPVQSDHRYGRVRAVAQRRVRNHPQRLAATFFPSRLDVHRDRAMSEQPLARFQAETAQVQRRPDGEGPRRADRVDASEEAAGPLEHLLIVEFGRAPAPPWADAEI